MNNNQFKLLNLSSYTSRYLHFNIDDDIYIFWVLTNCEPASQRASESCESCKSSCEREPCETNVSSCVSMCCITKMPRNSFIIPFSPSQMTLHLDPDLTQEQRVSVGIL